MQVDDTNSINDAELADQIAKEIISDIETYVDQHLEKYHKFTLDAPQVISSCATESTAQFFNSISRLKDVSILGRKLLESAPQFNAQITRSGASSPSSSNHHSGAWSSDKSRHLRATQNDDATSDDLLAALIESSSSDDFLVLSSSLDSITTKDMIMAALIYIKSHECFTLSQDIQSVAMVLRRIKFMILNILASKNQMELITKLLTSIGRCNEMNYVFDLFRDRNQFEILLSKGVEKTPELRVALFNYVKKNPEFYPLVTLNFSMFGEIAESLEASAVKRLKKVVAICNKKKDSRKQELSDSHHPNQNSNSNQVSQGTGATSIAMPTSLSTSAPCSSANGECFYSKESLNLSLLELIDAADCYFKAGCYKRSNYCERKAKLIALQLALLPSGTNVLDLSQSSSELTDLIASFKSFSEAYIVAEAYDCHIAWRQALFKNVILMGRSVYLANYCKKCDFSSALVEEIVVLYKQYIGSNELSQQESSNLGKSMRTLLTNLTDVELKCKIYSQLNFEDAKEELLRQDPAIEAHLKDLKLA